MEDAGSPSPKGDKVMIAKLKKSLAEKEKELTVLKDRAKVFILKTRSDMKEKDMQVKKLEMNVREITDAKDGYRQELDRVRKKLKEAEDSHAEVVRTINADYEGKTASLRNQLKRAEENFEKERKGLSEQQKQWAKQREMSHTTDLSTLMENQTLLKRKFIESEEAVKELSTKNMALSQELDERKKELTEFKNKVRAKIEKAAVDIRKKKELETELDAQRHKVEWAQRRIVDLQKQVSRAEAKAKAAEKGEEGDAIERRESTASAESNLPSPGQFSTKGQLDLLRSQMQMEELKAKHAGEMARVQEKLMTQVSALQEKLEKAQREKSTQVVRLERQGTGLQAEFGLSEDATLEEKEKYWREEKKKADDEMASMQQALESMRGQISATKELTVDNSKLRQTLADANRLKLQAQSNAVRLANEVEDYKQRLTVEEEEKKQIADTHRQQIQDYKRQMASLKNRVINSSIDDMKAKLQKEHQAALRKLSGEHTKLVDELKKQTTQAIKQAETHRKKREYAKSEFMKVFGELEGLRKKVGELLVERDLQSKRYRARISDLENMLGIEEDDDDDIGQPSSAANPVPSPENQHLRRESKLSKFSGGSNGDLYDIELVGVPQSLADVNHEELETRISSLKERVDDYLRFYKQASNYSSTTPNATSANDDLLSPELKKSKRPSPDKEAQAIKAHLEELLAMLVEVALHQKKCQVAITNLGVDSSQNSAQGCSAGVRLICKAMFGSCGGATPAGVPRRERGGEYRYDIVQ